MLGREGIIKFKIQQTSSPTNTGQILKEILLPQLPVVNHETCLTLYTNILALKNPAEEALASANTKRNVNNASKTMPIAAKTCKTA